MIQPQSIPSARILSDVGRYYTSRLHEHGPIARGVDWNSTESQVLRFRELLRVVDAAGDAAAAGQPMSLNDFGCGYGALVDQLHLIGRPVRYFGFDVSAAMIAAARAQHEGVASCTFSDDPAALQAADYTVASGIFNVKLDHPPDAWRTYMRETLETLHAASTRGFAFNVLSTCSDPERHRPDLFYADPLEWFAYCQRRFSRRVALLHDTPLHEFTMIVRA